MDASYRLSARTDDNGSGVFIPVQMIMMRPKDKDFGEDGEINHER